mmetsp:Transcript_50760/g.94907  ORF Transcript_50760/g.94907 Transcript_50760/m.94907 type:complete len:454 (-) Transcript_50760:87-1448(-)
MSCFSQRINAHLAGSHGCAPNAKCKAVFSSRWWAKQVLFAALLLEVVERHSVMFACSVVAASVAATFHSFGARAAVRRLSWQILRAPQPSPRMWRQALLLALSIDVVLQKPGVAMVMALGLALWFSPRHSLRAARLFLQAAQHAIAMLPTPGQSSLRKMLLAALTLEALSRLSCSVMLCVAIVLLTTRAVQWLKPRTPEELEHILFVAEKLGSAQAMLRDHFAHLQYLRASKDEAYVEQVWRPSNIPWAAQESLLGCPLKAVETASHQLPRCGESVPSLTSWSAGQPLVLDWIGAARRQISQISCLSSSPNLGHDIASCGPYLRGTVVHAVDTTARIAKHTLRAFDSLYKHPGCQLTSQVLLREGAVMPVGKNTARSLRPEQCPRPTTEARKAFCLAATKRRWKEEEALQQDSAKGCNHGEVIAQPAKSRKARKLWKHSAASERRQMDAAAFL